MMNTASNIVLVGPTGAGKSSLAKLLAQPLNLRHVDLDQTIEEEVGATIQTIFAEKNEAYFRQRESEILRQLLQRDGILLATGAGCVLDADNRRLMRERAFVVHIEISLEEQLRRLNKDVTRPLLQHPQRSDILREMARVRTPLYREVAHLQFNNDIARSSKGAGAQLLTQITRHWKRP